MAYAGKAGETRRINASPKSLSRKESRPIGVLASGLAIGLLVGAGVALLFAPQRGSDTRRGIRRGMLHAGRRGHDAWEDLRYELRRARRKLTRARRRMQRKVDEPEQVET